MTSKDIEYEAVIEYTTRLPSSSNGNPRYLIHFVGGATAKTKVDADVSYGLPNKGNIGVPVKVKATSRGLVYDVKPITN
jgi:hypothetical protein